MYGAPLFATADSQCSMTLDSRSQHHHHHQPSKTFSSNTNQLLTTTMSTNDDSSDQPKPKIFNSQEFMEFLAKQVDISKLTVVTKSGNKISASFNGSVAPNSIDENVFKSLDELKSLTREEPVKPGSSVSTVSLELKKEPTLAGGAFASKEWEVEYKKSHVDVTYQHCFSETGAAVQPQQQQQQQQQQQPQQKPPRIPSSSALPPKKRAGKTDWYGMYATALSPLVEAASLAQPQPIDNPAGGTDAETKSDEANAESEKKAPPKEGKTQSNPTKRKPRKIIPEIKEYVDEYSDCDVLFGRGGRSNHHPGNKIYRDIVTEQQPFYRSCDKNEKTKVAQSIVDSIIKDRGGRFLELEKGTNRWYVVPNIVARRKVGQALRENNTEEARAAKREKYGQGKLKKVEKVAVV